MAKLIGVFLNIHCLVKNDILILKKWNISCRINGKYIWIVDSAEQFNDMWIVDSAEQLNDKHIWLVDSPKQFTEKIYLKLQIRIFKKMYDFVNLFFR